MITASGAGTFDAMQRYQCPPLHVTIAVKDGKVSGTIERTYGDKVVDGYDQNAAPVTGTIDASTGKVNLVWQGIKVTGNTTRNHLIVTWEGECGQRVGVGELY
jgi:hypothetical protein